MKNCDYKCANIDTTKLNKVSKYNDIPILYSNIEKEVQEYERIIIQLLGNQYNLNINHLSNYLNLTSEDDKKIFFTVLENLINNETKFKDKNNKIGTCKLVNDFIGFVPSDHPSPNISIQKQHFQIKDGDKMIDLSGLVNKMKKERQLKIEHQTYNYQEIIDNLFSQVDTILFSTGKNKNNTNMDVTLESLLELYFDKMNYYHKNIILREIFSKVNTNTNLSVNEKTLLPLLKKYEVSYREIFNQSNNIKKFAVIVMNFDKLKLEYFDDKTKKFVTDSGLLKKL